MKPQVQAEIVEMFAAILDDGIVTPQNGCEFRPGFRIDDDGMMVGTFEVRVPMPEQAAIAEKIGTESGYKAAVLMNSQRFAETMMHYLRGISNYFEACSEGQKMIINSYQDELISGLSDKSKDLMKMLKDRGLI